MTSYDTEARNDGGLLPSLTMDNLQLRAWDRYPAGRQWGWRQWNSDNQPTTGNWSHPAESDDQKQNNQEMEAKRGKPIRHLGYEMHLGCRHRKGRGLLLQHRPPVQESIHATRQIKDNGHKENVTQAQSLGWGYQNEHCAQPPHDADQCTKDGRTWLHSGIW